MKIQVGGKTIEARERLSSTTWSSIDLYGGCRSIVRLPLLPGPAGSFYVETNDPSADRRLSVSGVDRGGLQGHRKYVIGAVEIRCVGLVSTAIKQQVLDRIGIRLLVSDRPLMHQSSLNALWVDESSLEARVTRLESLLDALVQMDGDTPQDPAFEKMHQALQRLGWTPYRTVDHRLLEPPIFVDYGMTVDAELDIGSDLPLPPTPARVVYGSAVVQPEPPLTLRVVLKLIGMYDVL